MPSPDSGGAWGVLGGSFDPVHNGHLNLASSIRKKKQLAGVLVVPSLRHPLKDKNAIASFADRITMLELALDNQSDLVISAIEKEQNLSGYTIDTLQALKKRFDRTEFYFIVGADLIGQLSKWYRADVLLKEFKFLAGGRPGESVSTKDDSTMTSIELVDIDKLDISASDIRSRIKNGAAKDEVINLLPANVADYIFEKKLYQ